MSCSVQFGNFPASVLPEGWTLTTVEVPAAHPFGRHGRHEEMTHIYVQSMPYGGVQERMGVKVNYTLSRSMWLPDEDWEAECLWFLAHRTFPAHRQDHRRQGHEWMEPMFAVVRAEEFISLFREIETPAVGEKFERDVLPTTARTIRRYEYRGRKIFDKNVHRRLLEQWAEIIRQDSSLATRYNTRTAQLTHRAAMSTSATNGNGANEQPSVGDNAFSDSYQINLFD
ncbi:uncharacterized protein BP01DRAFT_384034 [Aspergillus saccharolyticus JOP 1030-1]|uniref:Uncharacterized protein n=1 Tax=Aspergillus saccharolyticus JOP 1030-1 TaxID=1450539 RepID=A0A318ZUZ1_9EURO|nr:hypothetical protein BP01DRAFT_384034 [Aspergillus saccharolyticus JOP 1030-1]PYH43928.1 hypothetical protein BP01DRAFT_384034 [Aspergillus saccharolyticus JOP 1030-1]